MREGCGGGGRQVARGHLDLCLYLYLCLYLCLYPSVVGVFVGVVCVFVVGVFCRMEVANVVG